MLAFSFIIGAAFYRLLLAGGIRMRASEADQRKSNEMIKRVTLGLFGVFSLFLLLFTVNRGLLTGDVSLEGLMATSSSSPNSLASPKPPSSAVPPAPAAGAPSGGDTLRAIKDDPQMRAYLLGINISVNKPVCSDPSQKDCTTVGGLPPATITMLEQLRRTCSGRIEITGGTEAGHSSHGPGLFPVDIGFGDSSFNSCISSFVPSSRSPKKLDGSPLCNRVYENFGFVFCDEKGGQAHWHVYK